MQVVRRNLTLYATGLIALLLTSARPAGQSPGTPALTPANPTILVGQSQQFTPNQMGVPVAIAGGGYHTCMLFGDQTVRCAGHNNFGQLGNGAFTDSSTLVAASGLTTGAGV
ncbi:MAG: hypothetical protein ACJ731_06740, partial [Vicinamibacterales bacterium]